MKKTAILSNDEILNKLSQVDIFSMYAQNEEAMQRILDICQLREIPKGKTIIEESEYGDELYIILSGEIDILKKTLQNEKYTVTSLHADMGGIYVGELALIDNDIRSATVTAKTSCQCLVITRKNFLQLGDAHPRMGLEITRAIAGQIASRLRKSNSDVITLFSALVDEISSEGI
jgi:CRP/FNR family cyclic AMP-dependent transcriptional regulator